MYTSLVSAQEMKTPFEVICWDSLFDENPPSSGSADEYTAGDNTHKSYPQTTLTYSGL
jgi:hypothetical protein